MENESPAVRRAREIAQLIHTGDRVAARAYAEANYAPAFLGIAPMGRHVGIVSHLHDQTRGLAVLGVHSAVETKATLVIRGELTGILQGLNVEVEAEAPFRVTSIFIQENPQPASAEPPAKRAAASLPGELAAWLQTLADADAFSGAVALAKDGELLFAQAYGQANKDFEIPNNIDTAFNLGSMNKMFTAVAIAQLVEQGRLSFDDPLAKYLPDFPSAEAAAQIQIKHLLSHTAGLGSYFTEEFMAASRARYRTVNDFLALSREQPPAFPPGSKWQYSNTGFMVLGAVIEAVSGRDYFAHMRAALYEPAGMARTEAYELDKVNANLAVGYEKEFGDNGPEFRNNLFQHVIRGGPAGGGYSTVGDLVRFATALHTNRLLSPATTDLLLTPKPELNSPDYGYGFSVDLARGIVGHSGGFPGISSNLDLFRNNGCVAVVMSNYGMGSMPVVAKLHELIAAARV